MALKVNQLGLAEFGKATSYTCSRLMSLLAVIKGYKSVFFFNFLFAISLLIKHNQSQ